MDKKFRKHLLAIAFFTTALTSAFVVPNVYAGIIGDDCERSREICTPSTSEVLDGRAPIALHCGRI